MKIEVDDETFTKAFVEDLKKHIRMQRDSSFDNFETEDNKARLLSSLYEVLRYYSTPAEYKDFLGEIQNTWGVDCV